MKKVIAILIFMILINKCFAHKEWVHQYMVKQAFYLLEQQRGINYNVFTKRDFGINFSANVGVELSIAVDGISFPTTKAEP